MPVEAAVSTLSEKNNCALPEETVINSTEVAVLQYNEDFSPDPSTTFLFVSGSITVSKSHQTPKCEVKNITHEKVHCTSKELHNLHYILTEIWGICGGMDIKDMDNGERNIKFNQDKFFKMGLMSRDPGFNVATQGLRRGSHSLFDWT